MPQYQPEHKEARSQFHREKAAGLPKLRRLHGTFCEREQIKESHSGQSAALKLAEKSRPLYQQTSRLHLTPMFARG
jgi:hypothetical protein